MKRKFLIFGLPVFLAVFVGVFAICTNKIANEKTYSSYTQTLFFDDENMVLNGKQKIEFFNDTDNILSYVCLHLYANAFRENSKAKVVSVANEVKAYPNGKSYGQIDIESVSSGEKYLNMEIVGEDENILKVDFGCELYPNDCFEFEIGFSVKLANINHRLGYGENTINLCNYYPIICVYENGDFVQDLYNSNGDPFYSKISNYFVDITYNAEFELACSGEAKTEIIEKNKRTTISALKMRDFAMILSKKYTKTEEICKNVTLQYYYYKDDEPIKTIETMKNVLSMNEKFGSYPYKTLSVCQANFVHGGMEYPSLVLVADNLEDDKTHTNVVVHELCHQWWYGVVGNNQFSYGFLDEGLTDYNTAKFYDKYDCYGEKSETIFENATKMYCNFEKVYKSVVSDFSSKMIRRLDEFDTESEYVCLSYVKGMLMFATLENLLGENRMNKCLKYYYNCMAFSEATPNDLVQCFNKASGKNLTNFFNSWFDGNVVICDVS